ncbi:YIP1 family protein [Mucilaginibacter ginkgonis]|uniref:YIP1 family protein n=1 Tax=Mucilaginibacter ginkgonis TaxID=2682091 RepID=A0A6I4I090_9SPHI|nr:YIP1 family protein [Mucilaginibacter ginkgonis]QQL48325.1 YIP1 family protein [Mucilaginibacter ginkgonis]
MTNLYRAVLSNLLIKPKKAFKLIKRYDLDKYQFYFLILIGITNVIHRDFLKLSDINNNFWPREFVLILVGALIGWVGIYIYSYLIYLTGKWFGGHGDQSQIFNMLSYAAVPGILILMISLIAIIILRVLNFSVADYNVQQHIWGDDYFAIIQTVKYSVNFIAWCHFILTIIGLTVFQGFGIGKSIANVLAALMIIILPIALFVLALRLHHH